MIYYYLRNMQCDVTVIVSKTDISYITFQFIFRILKQYLYTVFDHRKCAQKEGGYSLWLICRASLGKRKNKLLVRGSKGAEWVFCPLAKSIRNDKISIDRCQRCKHFICLEQFHIPKTYIRKKSAFFRKPILQSDDTFHIARTLRRSKGIHPQVPPFSYIPILKKERQPLFDVFEEENHLIILAEMPSMDEKDVNIEADENSISITAENAWKRYLKKVWLPTSVKKDKIKFTYRNNILQVKLEKLNGTKHG
jgi:HSP20 family molecular chaperone IbpA